MVTAAVLLRDAPRHSAGARVADGCGNGLRLVADQARRARSDRYTDRDGRGGDGCRLEGGPADRHRLRRTAHTARYADEKPTCGPVDLAAENDRVCTARVTGRGGASFRRITHCRHVLDRELDTHCAGA